MKRSKQRVDESAEFKTLSEKIAKARKEEHQLKLADLMKERDEAKQNGEGKSKDGKPKAAARTTDEGKPLPDANAADDAPTPQLEEAVDIAADLVELTHRGT